MNNYCAFGKGHHCIKWQNYVSARLELEECDELCHGNWIEIESLQRQVHFVKVKSFAPRQIQRRSFAALAITLSRKIF